MTSSRSDHAVVAKLPQRALADADSAVSDVGSVIRQRGYLAPRGIVARVCGQDGSGCSARVVSWMHAPNCETVLPAIGRDDMASAQANDVQLRIAWTG